MTIDHGIIAAEQPNTPEVRRLLAERDAYFDDLYARKDRNAKPIDVERDNVAFFSVRVSGQLVGCGALLWRQTYGELKRFYIADAYRGRGLGRQLLDAIERHARRNGCRMLRLETGIRQPAALTLYRSAGFSETGCFGEYGPDPLSVFMEKTL
jgi:putative acetyltransferase